MELRYMAEFESHLLTKSSLLKEYFKPDYKVMFDRIKDIRFPVKNDLLMILLDGQWHTETELVRIAKKQQFMGAVTLGTMVNSINANLRNDYVEKRIINGEMCYKIADNYVGLSRAAYSKYRFALE